LTQSPDDILVVDDDPDLRRLVSRVLGRAGYTVREAADGRECLRQLFESPPSLVLLDVAMPQLDGWRTLERIREVSTVPVIMVTARDQELERVRGLRGGADDYIVKPFGTLELQARVEALLRRAREPEPPIGIYADGFLTIDHARREVVVGDASVPLTPTELRLLVVLVERQDRVVSRSELAELVWGRGAAGSPPMEVKQHLSTLRRKLETAAGRPAPIETRRGFGYRYMPPGGGHQPAA
jgi:DNA-binding response OmpR family regulator